MKSFFKKIFDWWVEDDLDEKRESWKDYLINDKR